MDYEDMLDRGIEGTPDIEGSSQRFDVPEPEVRQEGHASVFENFQGVCDDLGREGAHVLKFLQNEVGTSARIDESGRARLTGEFSADRIHDALESGLGNELEQLRNGSVLLAERVQLDAATCHDEPVDRRS